MMGLRYRPGPASGLYACAKAVVAEATTAKSRFLATRRMTFTFSRTLVSRPAPTAHRPPLLPPRILRQLRIQIQYPLRNRHQLVLVRNRTVVRLRELARARLRVRHALFDARLRPRPVALIVEVSVRPLERQFPATLVEYRISKEIVAQPRRHARNPRALANRVHGRIR